MRRATWVSMHATPGGCRSFDRRFSTRGLDHSSGAAGCPAATALMMAHQIATSSHQTVPDAVASHPRTASDAGSEGDVTTSQLPTADGGTQYQAIAI
jgi:hypothetical protein